MSSSVLTDQLPPRPSIQQAAAWLGVDPKTARRDISQGRINAMPARSQTNARRVAMNDPLTREQWLLSLPQAQAALGGIGLTLLYKLIDTGSIQRVKIGRRAFVTQASVDAFIASLTAA